MTAAANDSSLSPSPQKASAAVSDAPDASWAAAAAAAECASCSSTSHGGLSSSRLSNDDGISVETKRERWSSQQSEEEVYENPHGKMGWFMTGLFVVGELAGGGIVALPMAMIQTGLVPGLPLLLVTTAVMAFTACLLGRAWCMLLSAWPVYREHTRKPFAEIGYRACGPIVRAIVSFNINVTQFGVGVVFLLLSSRNIQNLLRSFFQLDIKYCWLIVAVAIFILPFTMLKSPGDFWWAILLAMFTTVIAVVLIVAGSLMDYGTCHPASEMPPFRASNFFLGFGTLVFSLGGHTAFPTIQHDMKRPADFTKSTAVAYSATTVLYAVTCIVTIEAYGDAIRDSVVSSIQSVVIQDIINVLITAHLVLAFTIVFNPLNQALEQTVRAPQNFCWQRVVVRSSLMAVAVFVAASVPTFGPLLNLVGSSIVSVSVVCFPCVFYLALTARQRLREQGGDDDRPATIREIFDNNSTMMLALCGLVILFGLLGGAAGTYSAIRDISGAHFEPPCYLSLGHHDGSNHTASTNCCGKWQNITTRAGVECSPPDLNFYIK